MKVTFSHSELRWAVYRRFAQWEAEGREGMPAWGERSTCLWKLLGRPQDNDRCYFMHDDLCTDAELRACELLLGEHGWTVYKMLVVRMEQ